MTAPHILWRFERVPRDHVDDGPCFEVLTALHDPTEDLLIATCWEESAAAEIVRGHNERMMRAAGAT